MPEGIPRTAAKTDGHKNSAVIMGACAPFGFRSAKIG